MAFFFISPFSDYYTTTASDSLQINTSRKVYIYIIVALLYMYHPKLHSEFVQVCERCFCVIVCCITSSFISVCVCVSDEVNFTSVVSCNVRDKWILFRNASLPCRVPRRIRTEYVTSGIIVCFQFPE